MSIYDFKVNTIDGDEICLEKYKGKVFVIVNTASKCGFTPQYEGLENLYERYKDKDFEILGFPSNQFEGQEPGGSKEIKNFCSINYGVSFQLLEKGDVRGEDAQPLFKYLAEKTTFKGFDMGNPIEKKFNDFLFESHPQFLEGNSIKWNFTKFLIGRDGNMVYRYEPTTEPEAMASDIEKLLEEPKEDKEIPYTGELDDKKPNTEINPFDLVYSNTKIQNM